MSNTVHVAREGGAEKITYYGRSFTYTGNQFFKVHTTMCSVQDNIGGRLEPILFLMDLLKMLHSVSGLRPFWEVIICPIWSPLS